MNSKRIKNNIASFVLIPLIVTAFWEKVLSPKFDIFVNYLFSFSNSFLDSISGYIYSRISEGVYINVDFYNFIFFMSSVLGILAAETFIFYRACEREGQSKPSTIHGKIVILLRKNFYFLRKPKCLYCISVFCFIFLYLFFFLFILMTNYINHTITRTMNNIEIVSPYISDQEYKLLNSKFHSMESSNDFKELYSQLEKYAVSANVKLKE